MKSIARHIGRRDFVRIAATGLLLATSTARSAAHDAAWAETIENSLKSVVRIAAGKDGNPGGTGFVVSAHGHIVTNSHVIASEKVVTIHFQNGSQHVARVLDRRTLVDLALLKLVTVPEELTVLAFANSANARAGEPVMAIGMPLDYPFSVSAGILSGFDRYYSDDQAIFLLQHDAALNPGNSGGPLIGQDGRVLGVNTATPPSTRFDIGIAFAVPADLVRNYFDEVLASGTYAYSSLGARLRAVGMEYSKALSVEPFAGLLVESVAPDSTAAEGLLQTGDLISQANGQRIRSPHQMARLLWRLKPGSDLELGIYRGEVSHTLMMKTHPQPEENGLAGWPSKLLKHQSAFAEIAAFGLSLQDMRLTGGGSVVVVKSIATNSVAEAAGLTKGDVILKINGRPPRDAATCFDVLSSKDAVLVLVSRHDLEQQYVVLSNASQIDYGETSNGVFL